LTLKILADVEDVVRHVDELKVIKQEQLKDRRRRLSNGTERTMGGVNEAL